MNSFRNAHVLLAIAATSSALQACASADAGPRGSPVPTVAVVAVAPVAVPITSEWVATVDGYVNAQIRSQVGGYLIARNHEEGAPVAKGQVLFEIDPRLLRVALAEAGAQLAQAEAELERTERDVQRNTPLAMERAIPRSQLENDVHANLAARARVKSVEALVESARLNLGFTKVRSLIDGVAAIATVQIGDLVTPSTLLTTVSQLDPMRVYFALSEREYLAVAERINRDDSARWASGVPLRLTLADGTEYPHAGSFLAADREVDRTTGTIRMSAVFPNPQRILRPGQYGRVRAEAEVLQNALLVPERAVRELQGAAQLRVVGTDGKVALRMVTLGRAVGGQRIVVAGLLPGERVVVDAPQLPDGTLVKTRPYAPAAKDAPAQAHSRSTVSSKEG